MIRSRVMNGYSTILYTGAIQNQYEQSILDFEKPVITMLIEYCLVNDLQDKPEGLDVSVLPTGSVSGLPVAPHPYG